MRDEAEYKGGGAAAGLGARRGRDAEGVNAALAARVDAIRDRYPDSRSLTLPALRFAQEEHGWLPPEALKEVADVLDLTPAYCLAVASFYDMFHLEPVGKHMVEVCTNLSCALVGAQRVVEALEQELGVKAGETTADGEITFRAVECMGACGYAPVVIVDSRYHQDFKPEDAAGLVKEIRGTA
jgi:NADH-quinone oxidoreductase subunit E